MILISLKNSLQNAIKAADFLLVFNNIATANKLGMWEKRRNLPLVQRCFSLVSRYHNAAVRTFLKPMIMIEHIKMMQIPCLDIYSMLLPG